MCSLRLLHRSKRCSTTVFLVSRHTCMFSATGSKSILERVGALKHFLRAFTKLQHRDGVESQVLAPSHSGGKDLQVSDGDGDGEVKFSRGKVFAQRMALARFKSFTTDHTRAEASWAITKTPTNLVTGVDIADQIGNEELTVRTSPLLKIAMSESGTCLDLHLNVINTEKTTLLQKVEFLHAKSATLLQKVEFLHAKSVPLSQVQVLLKKSAFVNVSLENLEMVVNVLTEFFKSKSIAFDVLTANAGILKRPVERLKQRLLMLEEFEINKETCIKVGAGLGMWRGSLETCEGALKFLRGLGLDAQTRSHMIRRCPVLLQWKASSMMGTVDFFESVYISGPMLLKLLAARPSLLGSSVDKNLMVKFKLFQDRGSSAKEFARAMYFVSLLSNEQIIMRLNLLRDQGLPPEYINKIIRLKPSILASSLQDLKAKLDFLVHTLRRDVAELWAFPQYLGCSLENRIVPRFSALEAVVLRKPACLSRILGCKTSVFKERFKIPHSVVC